MTSDSNRQRHYELAEMDWHRMAERRLAAMRAAGEDTVGRRVNLGVEEAQH